MGEKKQPGQLPIFETVMIEKSNGHPANNSSYNYYGLIKLFNYSNISSMGEKNSYTKGTHRVPKIKLVLNI